ncbi:hypothetical protein BJY01DRAFT_179039 [Aspergillus pseudoustus]|uniref:Ig-like domain-containing protein n=1 Tax=Aspergillus pseudoustus TaxID=1810923 RepID=A0ABR4KVW6_9EURO
MWGQRYRHSQPPYRAANSFGTTPPFHSPVQLAGSTPRQQSAFKLPPEMPTEYVRCVMPGVSGENTNVGSHAAGVAPETCRMWYDYSRRGQSRSLGWVIK